MTEIQSINPATNEILGSAKFSSEQEIKDRVKKAKDAQDEWFNIGLDKRIEHLTKLVKVFEENQEEIAIKISTEMGMPIKQARDNADRGIVYFQWNIDNAKKYLSPQVLRENDDEIAELVFEPFGVLACIGAWNFPLLNLDFGVAQALLVGNTAIFKYSEEIILFSHYMEELCKKANLPEGVFQFVHGDGTVGDLLTSQDIDFISFTGSYNVGKELYKKAAEKFIPIVMELGGSSPGVIFNDVDINDEIINSLFWNRFANTAQYCSNLKRLIVHEDIFDEVVEKLAKFTSEQLIGNPLEEENDVSCLVAERQVVKLEEQLKDAVDKGAKVICGGRRPENLNGAFFSPTILTNITKDMLVWKEEVFGPILPVISFKTYEEAIELANDTIYGLTAYLYTNDKKIQNNALRDIKAGCIGTMGISSGGPNVPFGGYKASGIGRENGEFGFHEVAQKKVIARRK